MADQATQQQNGNQKYRMSQQQNNQNNLMSNVIIRERSFIRNSNQHNTKNRRSLAIIPPNNQQHQGMRGGKPAMEIYRPPNVRLENKLNVHAQEFSMNRPGEQQLLQNSRSSLIFPAPGAHLLQQSKSSASIPLHQQMQHLSAVAAANRHQRGGAGHIPMSHVSVMGMPHHHSPHVHPQQYQQSILVTHPMQMNQMANLGMSMGQIVNSPTNGNMLHQNNHRVKFAVEPEVNQSQNYNYMPNNNFIIPPLQRSKSLSSADAITRGIAGLGLALGDEATDIGVFPSEIQLLIEKAMDDPNQLSARNLMELANHVMQRAIEGRRYALSTSKLCISIIAKEQSETFLEAMLNNCRQWYQEREKILYSYQGMKSPARTKFTAFMAFLTEMFCQLKRRQLQLRTQCDGAPPPLVLLTLLSKCCEDCVKPPVRSLSEIECLFFVLTCIGRDLETQLPQQLEILLASVRDAFLNSNASAPAIRRTLLQLIELHASNWQLPGNTVLYYYPSTK